MYKKLFFIFIYLSLGVADRYMIDIDESRVFWVGRKVTGEHSGTIRVKEGYIDISDNQINGGKIIIDMESIKVSDIKEEKWNKKLEGHLKSSDFFSVDEFSEASFSINGSYNFFMIESLAIQGDLTIKGKGARGNIVTKNPVRTVELKSTGVSTLSARKIWFDDNIQRLNVEGRGEFLGDFKAEDKILIITQDAKIELKTFQLHYPL